MTYKSLDFQGQRPSQRSRRHGARVVGALAVRQTMGTSEREEIMMWGKTFGQRAGMMVAPLWRNTTKYGLQEDLGSPGIADVGVLAGVVPTTHGVKTCHDYDEYGDDDDDDDNE